MKRPVTIRIAINDKKHIWALTRLSTSRSIVLLLVEYAMKRSAM